MKVLFLDIDGVVNCDSTKQRHRGAIGIDPYMAFLVGKIVLDTDVKVVLSSSWRHFPDGKEEVERQVTPIYDVTPTYREGMGGKPRDIACLRGREIEAWLDEHPNVTRYAILDDNIDMLPEQMPNFFKTSWIQGITPEIALQVTNHLNT